MKTTVLTLAAVALALVSAPPNAEAGRLKDLAKIAKASMKYNGRMLTYHLPDYAKRDGIKGVKDLTKMSIGANKVYLKCAIDPKSAPQCPHIN